MANTSRVLQKVLDVLQSFWETFLGKKSNFFWISAPPIFQRQKGKPIFISIYD